MEYSFSLGCFVCWMMHFILLTMRKKWVALEATHKDALYEWTFRHSDLKLLNVAKVNVTTESVKCVLSLALFLMIRTNDCCLWCDSLYVCIYIYVCVCVCVYLVCVCVCDCVCVWLFLCVCLSTDENAIEAEVKKSKGEKSSLLFSVLSYFSLSYKEETTHRRRKKKKKRTKGWSGLLLSQV